MVIGEMTGQLLLVGRTGLAMRLWRTRAIPAPLAVFGMLILPFWLLGQSKLVQSVVPSVPAIETIPLAFIAWEARLAAIAVSLLARAWRLRALPRAAPFNNS